MAGYSCPWVKISRARAGGHQTRDCRADFSPPSGAFFKKEADLKPHLSRYWLNPTIDDPDQFKDNVQQVSDLYRDAPALAAEGVHVHSCDEMTGIPAREQAPPALPMAPGKVERREFEVTIQVPPREGDSAI